MRTPRFPSLALPVSVAVLVATTGCGGPSTTPSPAPVTLTAGDLRFEIRDGVFQIGRAAPLFSGATADVLYSDGGTQHLATLRACAAPIITHPTSLSMDYACPVAQVSPSSPLWLALHAELAADGASARLRLDVTNAADHPLTLLRVAPLVVDATQGGAVALGPAVDARVLENGRFIAFDTTAQLVAGDVGRFSLANVVPIPLRGNSVSNWNHTVTSVSDPARSLVAGWLSFDHAVPTLGVAFDPSVSATGATTFTTYAAEEALVFHGKTLASGAHFSSETLYLDPSPADPLEALEAYASAVAEFHHITPWTKRGPSGNQVPCGWNSWSGGSGTGGYGQDISDAVIAQNLDVFRRQLQPFGDGDFQIDDGWQTHTGDWQWKPDTFPGGGPAQTARIAAAGLRPGLWLSPFTVRADSDLARAHPDWLQPKEDGAVGALAMDKETLDLTNPDALAWLTTLFTRLRTDGFKWIKVDFTYWDVLGKPQHDPSLTNIEAFRQGYAAIRDALGPDVFLLGIGLMGANIGTLDGMRLTLDNGPQWEEKDPEDVIASPRSFKSVVRTGARRWFYQNRVWINHDDSIYFRAWPDKTIAPITLEESRAFASFVGASGGSVELGDKLAGPDGLDANPAWIDIARRLLPAWPDGSRPVDVMLRDYPEQYLRHVHAPAGDWDVITLANWGRNRDFSTNPPTPLGETTRRYELACGAAAGCFAWEFWSEQLLGTTTKAAPLAITVDARRAKIVALRPITGKPQLLGTNRHVTLGAVELGPLTWDEAQKRLSGTLLGAVGSATAPFVWHLAFHAAGRTLDRVEVDGVAMPDVKQEGEVVRANFTLPPSAQGQQVAFRVVFH